MSDALCQLESNKGTWFVTTPGTVTIHRSYNPIHLKCTKDGVDPGIATVESSTKGMAWGNILAGGIIGAAVDMGTGSAYDYPPLITVLMGQTITVVPPKPNNDKDVPAKPEDAQQASTQATTTQAAPAPTPIQIGPTSPQ
ncbi:MAG TPA: hypothetical protein VGC69_04705 [Bordetella sp.]